jgi:Tol biopolymer transport system component
MRRMSLFSALLAVTVTAAITVPPRLANASLPGQNGRIAYVTTVGDHRAIYTADPSGGDPQPLIDLGTGRDAINPAWSWDGTKIAFAGQVSPDGPFAIYAANADGSGSPNQVTTPTVSDSDPTWEPTGEHIAFVRAREDGSSRISIVDMSSSNVSALGGSMGTDLEPAWSPEGSTIAFASKVFPPIPCPQKGCRFGIFIARADGSGLVGALTDQFGTSSFYDWHHPDWSPDGSKIVSLVGQDEYPLGSLVEIHDASSGLPITTIGPGCGFTSEPLFSPDGTRVVVTSMTAPPPDPFSTDPSTDATLSDPTLCVLAADGSVAFPVPAPASDAAWDSVPGSAPAPQPDRVAPAMSFSFDPQPGGDGSFPYAPDAYVTATDNIGVTTVNCTYDDQWLTGSVPVLTEDGLTRLFDLYPGNGSHSLACRTMDLAGNVGTDSIVVYVGEAPPSPSPSSTSPPPVDDTTPPHVDPPSLSADPIAVGGVTTVTAYAWDDGSGIESGTVIVGDDAPIPMAWSGVAFTADIGTDLAPDLYPVTVRVRDAAGNETTSDPQTLVVYDPNGGSVSGTGWIVPDPSAGDQLPGIDGRAKGSFSLAARYKSDDAPPSGSFVFTYGKLFKLQSERLDWLVVTAQDTAYFQGVASIRNDGVYPFRVMVRDGAATGTPDHLVLEVCGCASFTETGPMMYRASGEVGGQIQIQR